ncbi:MAG: hypothetical protein LBT01_08395 [Spirochaetaceae bacterium]|nr:hypothetical protein [Spirochaetaceae bacterium]
MADKIQSDLMRSFEDIQYEPSLGIGWVYNNALIDLTKQLAPSCIWNDNGCRTVATLHKDYWKKKSQKMRFKFNKYDTIYNTDYTSIPRFRIFEYKSVPQYRVMVGSWITDNIKEMIIDEFDLPPETEFIIDTHWELGHGWSEEYMLN